MSRIAYLALASICLIFTSVSATAQVSDPYNNPIINDDLQEREIVDRKAFKKFCTQYFPGLLEYFSKTVTQDDDHLYEAAAEELVDIFEEYQEMVSENRAGETQKYLDYKGSELRSWRLGREIMDLRLAQINGASEGSAQAIEKKEAELYQVLEQQYSLKLEYQKREFEEMRRELVALEQALKKRSMLKDQIIRRRILELTGDDDVMDWD